MFLHMKSLGVGFVLLLFLSLVPNAALAAPFNAALVQNRFCLTGAQAAAVSAVARRNPSAIHSLAAQRRTLTIPLGGTVSSATQACRMSPQSEQLSSNDYAIPAIYASSLNAVHSYQTTHAASDTLRFQTPGTAVLVYAYGSSYVIVAFAASRVSSGGQLALGCKSEASYRVTLRSSQVYQFDGCVEARVRSLPTLSQLPPR